jgi:uncharacterized protein YqgC (DUF456 family)
VQRTVLSILRIVAGSILLLLGIAGLFLPILQGWLMIFAGLLLLFPEETAAGHSMRAWIRAPKAALARNLELSRRKKRRFF